MSNLRSLEAIEAVCVDKITDTLARRHGCHPSDKTRVRRVIGINQADQLTIQITIIPAGGGCSVNYKIENITYE